MAKVGCNMWRVVVAFLFLGWNQQRHSGMVQGYHTNLLSIEGLQLDPVYNFFEIAEGTDDYEGNGYVDLSDLTFTVSLNNNSKSSSESSSSPAVTTFTYIDVVVVPIPEHCFSRRPLDGQIVIKTDGDAVDCDWTESLGVGYKTTSDPNNPEVWYCCSDQAVNDAKICSPDQRGRLIVNPQLFSGYVRNVTVPPPKTSRHGVTSIIVDDAPVIDLPDAGTFVVLLANCNGGVPGARTAVVNGAVKFVSYTADWEQFLFENVPFYLILTIAYVLLWAWFGYLMRQNKESRIRLEEWILATIILGFADAAMQFIQDFVLEDVFYSQSGNLDNVDGLPDVTFLILTITGALVGAVKHALSRYLLLLLSLGWGVVHASVEPTQGRICAILAISYCALSALMDLLFGFFRKTMATNVTIMNIFNGSFYARLAIDILFLVWIPTALCRTMNYLQRSNQTRKLERYRSLLHILGFAVLLTLGLVALMIMDFMYDGGQEITMFNVTQGNELNFFLILLCVARLWKPNPMARDFAYAMEVSMLDDDENGVGVLGMDGREGYFNDLELTETITHHEPIADEDNNDFVGSTKEIS